MEARVTFVNRIVREEEGQDMIEYALLVGFLSVGIIAVLFAAGDAIVSIWTAVTDVVLDVAASL